jgi:hypothetical protein
MLQVIRLFDGRSWLRQVVDPKGIFYGKKVYNLNERLFEIANNLSKSKLPPLWNVKRVKKELVK